MQTKLYKEFAKKSKKLTFEIMLEIETQALIKLGVDPIVALATVKKAIDAIKARGIIIPKRIPMGGINA